MIGKFSPREHEILFRLAEVAMPQGRVLPAYPRTMIDRMDTDLAYLPVEVRRGYHAALWALESGAYVSHRQPMSALPPAERLHYLQSWANGSWPQRQIVRLLALPLKMLYYDAPEILERLGVERKPPPAPAEEPRWLSQVTDSRDLSADVVEEAEVVVVGSGAGGAAAADLLASRGNAVVLLEEGSYLHRHSFTGRLLETQQRSYRNSGMLVAVGNTVVVVPAGICVGGSTTINSGTCFRTPERTLRRWREEYGLTDYTAAEMAPWFERVEAMMRIAPAKWQYVGKPGEIIARGAGQLGYRHGVLSRNAPDCEGRSVCGLGCPTDAKRGAAVSFVPHALEHGARLFTNTRMEKLLVERGVLRGVVGRSGENGRQVVIRAPVVVLALGALFTPLMLMQQKIGNRSGQLGRNLSLHPAAGVIALMDAAVEGWKFIPQSYMVDEYEAEGILIESFFAFPDFTSLFFSCLGAEFQQIMEQYSRMAMCGFLIEDESRGLVRPGLRDAPLILYYLRRGDREKIVRGLGLLARIYLAAGARRIFTPLHRWRPMSSEADLEDNLRRRVAAADIDLTAYHPLGTCHMGASAKKAVCDPHGEVHGLPNLFICDGSIIPPGLGVNPMVTISAVAQRTAAYIHERLNH